jgi:cell division initiation protein
MNYTPNDLQNIAFKKSMLGGLSEDSVNDVLDKIIEDYNSLVQENIELKDKVVMLNDGIRHYKTIEESLQNTLVVAQQTGEDIKKNAMERAENIIRESELRAQKLLEDANQEVLKIRFEYEEMRKKIHLYKAKSENLLMSQLEMLKLVLEEVQ